MALALIFAAPMATAIEKSRKHKESRGITMEQQVSAAADSFLKKMQPLLATNMADYGFHADDKLDTLRLDKPFQLYGLRDDSIRDYKQGEPLLKHVEKTNRWFVPVKALEEARVLIEVTKDQKGQWNGTGLGWAPLARKWQKISGFWPQTGKTPIMLVMPYSMPGYFFSIPSRPDPNLTSMSKLNAESASSEKEGPPTIDDAWSTLSRLRKALAEQQPGDDAGS